jgi:hypothetical protein
VHGLARLTAIAALVACTSSRNAPREHLDTLDVLGGAVEVRVLYANDPEVPANLRRSRAVFPVGQPPRVVAVGGRWLPTLFVRRERWEAVEPIDAKVAAAVDDACRAAWLNSSQGRCFDFTGALAAAVLAADTAARVRLCTLMVAHGCGSVPAPTETAP